MSLSSVERAIYDRTRRSLEAAAAQAGLRRARNRNSPNHVALKYKWCALESSCTEMEGRKGGRGSAPRAAHPGWDRAA